MNNDKTNKYLLIDYFDVWGNQEDGWEVNDLKKFGTVYIKDNATDEEIIDHLISIGYLVPEAKGNMTIICNDDKFIEIFETETDMPFCRLELIV